MTGAAETTRAPSFSGPRSKLMEAVSVRLGPASTLVGFGFYFLQGASQEGIQAARWGGSPLGTILIILGAALLFMPLRTDRRSSKSGDSIFLRSFRTLALAASFPIVHFFLRRFSEPTTPATAEWRERVVAFSLLLLGGMAFAQYSWLVSRAKNLWRERQQFEERLRSSEQDLRLLVEQHQVEEAYREADQRFDLAFQAYPYGLSFHSFREGRFLDVNPALERLLEYRREDLLDKTPEELDFWASREEMLRFQDCLSEQKELREHLVRCRDGAGREKNLLMSVAQMDDGSFFVDEGEEGDGEENRSGESGSGESHSDENHSDESRSDENRGRERVWLVVARPELARAADD